jgi:peptidoglycan/LPS O-acetylase OafA/YrhL
MEGLALGGWLAIRFRMGYEHTAALNRTIGFLISPMALTYVILWLIVFRGSRLTVPLRWAPVQYLGKVSYAAYLLHWPAGNLLRSISTVGGIRLFDRPFPTIAAIYVLTFLGAAISWHFFEKPLLNLKDRLYPARQASTRI